MAKNYSENFIKNLDSFQPKESTIDFLLNYSKALRINDYNNMKFEMLLN